MKFETKDNTIVCCKDNSYQKKFYYANYFVESDDQKTYYNGLLIHNEYGPAIEWYNGNKSWCLDGLQYTEKEFLDIMKFKTNSRVLNEI